MAIAPLRAARLRHKLKIYRPIETEDGGASATSWALMASPWAQVMGFTNRRGGEEMSADAQQSVVFYRMIIRYRPDLDGVTDIQVVHRGRTLNVTAAYDPEGDCQQLWLQADTLAVRDMGL